MSEKEKEFIYKLKDLLKNKEDRKYLLKLISEACEDSYRRGVQHALYMQENNSMLEKFYDSEELHDWRFSDKKHSLGLDGYKTSSLERFLMENWQWEFFYD